MTRWLARLVTTTTTAALLIVVGLLVVLPRATGAVPLAVLTGSMTPTIPAGSLVLVTPTPADQVVVGDVLTFAVPSRDSSPVLVTHRVVDVVAEDRMSTSSPAFVTRGDANRGPDADLVRAENVRGVVWFHVPLLGRVMQAAQGPGGLAAVGSGALALFALALVTSPGRPRLAAVPRHARS